MKHVGQIIVFVIIFAIAGCGTKHDLPLSGNAIQKDKSIVEMRSGGIYAAKNDEGKYTLAKILVFDGSTVHARFYNEKFDDIPTNISSDNLTFLIGHVPMAANGFLAEHRNLIVVEDVSDSELAGYKLYLEAMSGN